MSKINTEIYSAFTEETKDSITRSFNLSMQDKLSPDELKKQSSELFKLNKPTRQLDAGAYIIHKNLFQTAVTVRVEEEPDIYSKRFKGVGSGIILGLAGLYWGVIYSDVDFDTLFNTTNNFWAGSAIGGLYVGFYNDSWKMAYFLAAGMAFIAGACAGDGRFYDK